MTLLERGFLICVARNAFSRRPRRGGLIREGLEDGVLVDSQKRENDANSSQIETFLSRNSQTGTNAPSEFHRRNTSVQCAIGP